MKVEFDKRECRYLHRLAAEIQSQEQTQELRLTEGMPDIGSIIGAWGQVLIRGKEWRGDSMIVSGGVMVWTLYAPEDGSGVQKVEGWLPFQIKWQLPDTPRDGVILAAPYLRSVDARSISARKLMLRTVVEILAEAYIQEQTPLHIPGEVPGDLQVLRQKHTILLPKEAGERHFEISETLQLPASAPPLREVIRFDLRPEIVDEKVMTDKGVFRGSAVVHLVYDDPQGQLHCWDFDVPFSQYTQLDSPYEEHAQLQVIPAVTALELETADDGMLNLTAGMTCQYLVYDNEQMELAQDAYGLRHCVQADAQVLNLPRVMEIQTQSLPLDQSAEADALAVVDAAFWPAAPRILRQPGGQDLELSGQLQVLYYDPQEKLCAVSTGWSHTLQLPAEGVSICAYASPTGIIQGHNSGPQLQMTGKIHLQTRQMVQAEYPMIGAVTLGEEIVPDPDRPSLILRRVGQEDLWHMAKDHGTTVEQIRRANGLEGDPAPGQMLLIPIP